MNLVSKCGLVAFVSTVAFMSWADAAAAGAEGWRIVDTVGTVRSGAPGVQPAALSNDQVLPADAWVETGADGRVVLKRGRETIAVSPKSRVLLPDEEVNGNTQVLQTLGSAFYQIGKEQKPHFQVDTPYLAAVVKGTAFTVTVDEGKSSVTVTEGLVEVATPDRGDTEFVKPGFTALVSHEKAGKVDVQETPATKNDTGAPEATPRAPSKDEHTSNDVVNIPGTIGELTLDIPSATEGLASGDVPKVVPAATNVATDAVPAVRTAATDVATTTVEVASTVGDTAGTTVGGVTSTVGDVGGGVISTVGITVDTTVGDVATVVATVPTVVDPIVNPGGQTLPAQASQTAQTVVTTIVNTTTSAVGGVVGGVGGLLGRGR